MVVEPQIMVDYRVVNVVRLDQVFERTRSFLGVLFNVVNLDRGNVDAR